MSVQVPLSVPASRAPPRAATLPELPDSVPQSLAAIDLGSNSFHMVVARVVDGEPAIIDRLREQVQLRAGLDRETRIHGDVRDRALACLERFGQRVRGFAEAGVRAVATDTLRVARNADEFLADAERALGRPIEILSGLEEARLIYLGVSHTLESDSGTRLVIDIGGGSTEYILGRRFDAELVGSLKMGCVSFTERFFANGQIKPGRLEKARFAARVEAQSAEQTVLPGTWTSAVGASGTIRTAERVLRLNGWSEGGITVVGLAKLREAMLEARNVDRLRLEGLKPERAAVFPAGVAILSAVMEALSIERLEISSGALREGVLFDLLGRLHQEDVRDRSVRALQERFHADREQALRVEHTVLGFLLQVAEPWQLDPEIHGRFLSWAAWIHEIGLAIHFDGHHRHAGYLVANCDLPGFSRDDQQALAVLVETQRGKLRRARFDELLARRRRTATRMAVLFRLAARLNRSRRARPRLEVLLEAGADDEGDWLRASFPAGWLDSHPLTRADLEAEIPLVHAVGIRLEIAERAPLA